MLVRCGRCRVEIEISGPGEFACPSCGTRNVVRGGGDPLGGVPDLGGLGGQGPGMGAPAGIGGPGQQPSPFGTPPSSDEGPPPGVSWVTCSACSYRFAVGEVEQVDCPTCGASITVSDAASSDD